MQFYINGSQEICLHVFGAVEKIIREPGLVRTTGSAVIYFYVIFSAFFEFIVLAVYVAACNFWHIAPFLSYYMCTRQSAVSVLPPKVVIYNMPNSLSKKTQMPLHAAAAFKQRKEFFRRRIRLMYQEDSSSSSLIYIVYQIFRCTQIFVGFFCRQQKSAVRRFFQIRKLFSFVFFLMYSSAYALALIISAASICGINLSIVLAVMISFLRN